MVYAYMPYLSTLAHDFAVELCMPSTQTDRPAGLQTTLRATSIATIRIHALRAGYAAKELSEIGRMARVGNCVTNGSI